MAASTGADALVIVTEWDAFRALDLERVQVPAQASRSSSTCATSTVPQDMAEHGFTYVSVGRADGPRATTDAGR